MPSRDTGLTTFEPSVDDLSSRPPAQSQPVRDQRPGTVLLSVPHVLVARDLLASGVADGFVARGWKVVTISPTEANRAELVTEFAGSPMLHELVSPDLGGAARLHMKLMDMQFATLGTLSKYMALVRDSDALHATLRTLFPVGRPAWRRTVILAILERILRQRAQQIYADILNRHRPNLVLVPSPGFRHEDQTLIRAARLRSIPTLAVVSSWDNLTGRGAMKVEPDEFCVWNEPMVTHAERYHGIARERVHITGAAQFDTYAHTDRMFSRAEVERRLGVAPGRVIITYLTAAGFNAAERFDLEMFITALKHRAPSAHGEPLLVIRVHPHEDERLYHQFVEADVVVLDPNAPPTTPGASTSDMTPAMAREYWKASLLSASDVVFASCATTALIESCIFDRPSFLVTPGERPGVDQTMQDLARAQLVYTHQVEAQEVGAIKKPASIDALLDAIDHALDHPEHLRPERAALVARMCHQIDGRASARILDIALRCADREPSRSRR